MPPPVIDKRRGGSHPCRVPRKLRIEYAGALYHVTNRGNRGEVIFADDEDRRLFLATLAAAVEKTGWELHAFCLLPDHFHLVLETPQPNVVQGMKWFLSTYTNRFNRRHQTRGHVFAGRYRAVPLAPDGPYFADACDHVHLNPARSGLVEPSRPLSAFPWSSLPHYLQPPAERPAWLTTRRLLDARRLADDPDGRQQFARIIELRRQSERTQDWALLRRGWWFGDADFHARLLDRLATGEGLIRHGAVPPEVAVRAGDRIVAEELARLGWTEAELAKHPKAAPEKIEIAARLRRETVLSLRWIAGRLQAGSPYTLRNALQAKGRTSSPNRRSAADPRPAPRAVPRATAADDAPTPPRERSGRTSGHRASVPASLPGDLTRTSGADPFSVAWD